MMILLRVSEAEILYTLITGIPQGETPTERRGIRRLMDAMKQHHLSLMNRDLFLVLETKFREAIEHAYKVRADGVSAHVEPHSTPKKALSR